MESCFNEIGNYIYYKMSPITLNTRQLLSKLSLLISAGSGPSYDITEWPV